MKAKALAILAGGVSLLCAAGCSVGHPATAHPSIVSIHVDYPYYSSVAQLAQKADLVVKGTLLSSRVQAADDAGAPTTDDQMANPDGEQSSAPTAHTIFTFKVSDCFKGDCSLGSIVEVSQLGGVLDGVTYVLAGADKFAVGGRYLLFLGTFSGHPAVALNLTQGAYLGDPDGAGDYSSAVPGSDWKIWAAEFVDTFGS